MSSLPAEPRELSEVLLRSLARELAIDILPVETIVKNHQITQKQLQEYLKLHSFRAMVMEQKQIWGAATNTAERVKLKYLSALEMSADLLYARMVDPQGSLAAQVELMKAMMRGAEIGTNAGAGGPTGEKVSITINMADQGKEITLTAEKTLPDQVTQGITIDG